MRVARGQNGLTEGGIGEGLLFVNGEVANGQDLVGFTQTTEAVAQNPLSEFMKAGGSAKCLTLDIT